MNSILDTVFKGFFFMALAVIVVAGVAVVVPQCGKLNGLVAQRDALRQRIDAKKVEIAAVREKQNRFKTDREFVESIARENRRAKADETVFIFND